MPRKLKSQDGNPYEAIRGMWEGAYVSQFVRLFRNKFGFTGLSTQELEDSLIASESLIFADVCARLLRYLTGKKDILVSNFDSFLRQLLQDTKAEIPHLQDCTSWQDITPEEKLGTLKWLVDHVYKEKEEDLSEYLDENFRPDDLRGICAGQDAFNNAYWYLDDLRLYRENSPKKPTKKDLECVCLTLHDWQSFLKQFRKTTNPQERELYTYLNYQLFPVIESELQDLTSREIKNKEVENLSIIKREREELGDMLEKKPYIDGSKGTAAIVDANGEDSFCHENHNGTSTAVKGASENGLQDFVLKTEEQKSVTLNHCDEKVNSSESVGTLNSVTTTMDMKTGAMANSCNNPCGNSCNNSCGAQEVCNGGATNCNSSGSTNNPLSNTPSRDNKQDVNMQPLSDNPSDTSVNSNKENAPPATGVTGVGDVPPVSAMSNMVCSTATPTPTTSVQPLPSNMLNKSTFSMETQYMQQQSQIFVFSTALANKAAETVISGQFPSIIAFHCAQPGTKRFLEKHPLKVQQFNRQNPAAWLNSLAQMKQGGRHMKGTINQFPGLPIANHQFPGTAGPPGAPHCSGPCSVHGAGPCTGRGPGGWPGINPISGSGITGPNLSAAVSPEMMCGASGPQSWPQQQFPQGVSGNSINPRFQNTMNQGMVIRGVGPGSASPMMGCINNINPMAPGVGTPPYGGPFPSPTGAPGMTQSLVNQGPAGSTLTGVKIPDENLTPQQRQHREEQLAMIRKMHQLLFPDQHQHDQPQNAAMASAAQNNMLAQTGQHRFSSGSDMCLQPGMDMAFPHQTCVGLDHDHSHPPLEMFSPSSMMGHQFHHQHQQNLPPASVAAQLEWQKLQQQFYEERRKKQGCGNASGGGPPSINSSVQQTSPQQSQQLQQQIQQQQQQIQQQHQVQKQQSQQPGQSQQQGNMNSPSPSVGLSPGTRMQGPPPPYHQTARGTMPSPHPASPNPGSLSLPSPRMGSGLPSPADPSRQFSHLTPPGPRLPHPSPGAVTPAGSSSIHNTPLNSPKPPTSSSGPSSNSAVLTRTPTTPSNPNSTPTGTPTNNNMGNILPSPGPSTPSGPCNVQNRKGSTPGSQQQQPQPSGNDMAEASLTLPTTSTEFTPSSHSVSTPSNSHGEGIFVPTLHCGQPTPGQKQLVDQCPSHSQTSSMPHKEPSLMPVPSPQQIQYLNAFDGQELTIQKQPNTSLRDLDMISPTGMPTMDLTSNSHHQFHSSGGPHGSFGGSPGGCTSSLDGIHDGLPPRYSAPDHESMEGGSQRFPVPSPQMSNFEGTHRHMVPTPQSLDGTVPRFPGTVPFENIPRMSGPGTVSASGMEGPMPRFSRQSPQGSTFGSSQLPGSVENVHRFPVTGCSAEVMQRFRGPSPHNSTLDMIHSRFIGSSPHMPGNENMQSAVTQFGPMASEPVQSYPSPASSVVSGSSNAPCGGPNFATEGSGMNHSHIQNLQKMTPPFDMVPTNKMPSEVIPSIGPGSGALQQYNDPVNTGQLQPSSQSASSQRLSHFDPIASMAAMSESTGLLVTTAGNSQPHQGMMTTTMNMSSMQVASNAANGNQPNMVNFHTNMQSMQGVHQTSGGGMHSQHQYNMSSQMAHNLGGGPQTVNNTYVNATMSIQQLNIQNVTTSTYNANIHVPPMNLHNPVIHQQSALGSGAHTVSSSVTTNHPIMHSAVSPKSATVSMGMTGPSPRAGPQSYPGQSLGGQRGGTPMGPSMMPRAPGAVAPFNSTNIQVKASAPNTIQYLPARPQNSAPAPNRPPSLEFLQRFAAPLTNLDNKVPTHNLQYFPSTGGSSTPTGSSMTASATPTTPGALGSGMITGQRPLNISTSPMMRASGPSASGVSQTGGQMFGGVGGFSSGDSPMFVRAPGSAGSGLTNQMVPMAAMGAGQVTGVFANKQLSMPMSGMAPDATQPLPPSMGQSFNYKHSPFYGPTTADPNYAVQFHNFQQQLYATNTRGSQIGSQTNLTAGQGFFGPK